MKTKREKIIQFSDIWVCFLWENVWQAKGQTWELTEGRGDAPPPPPLPPPILSVHVNYITHFNSISILFSTRLVKLQLTMTVITQLEKEKKHALSKFLQKKKEEFHFVYSDVGDIPNICRILPSWGTIHSYGVVLRWFAQIMLNTFQVCI